MRLDAQRWRVVTAGLAVAVAGGASWLSRIDHVSPIRQTAVRLPVPSAYYPCRFEEAADRTLPRVSCSEPSEASRRDAIEASRRWLADGALDSSFARREGVALLMVGNPAAAINRLEAGLHDGQDRELLAELGAARIELALARDDPYGLVQALDDLERAKRSGGSISLDYNRALVLALLNLRGPAREAWARVRDGDDDPHWRNDAEMWLVQLSRPTIAEEWQRNVSRFRTWLLHGEGDAEAAVRIARRHPQHARILAEEEGFAAWAAAVASSRHEVAAAVASRLVILGRELSTVSGDPLLSRSAEAVAACDERTCAALSEGHRRYTLARRLHESQDYAAAEVLFVQSFEDLVRARSPFAFWPAFYRTIVIAHRPDFDRAAREFRSLLNDPGATGPIVRAYLHWMLGHVALRQSEYGAALGELELARDLFRASGEAENEQEMENQLGRIWDAVGKPQRAWRHHFRALSLLGRSVKSRRIENALSAAAAGLRNRGEHAAAVVLQEACVAQAKGRGREIGVALALRYKAQSLDGLGDERAALRSVKEGLEWAQRIPDAGLRADTSAHLLLTWGAIARSDLPRALENVEKAIQFAKRHEVRYLLPEGYATEAALRRELGDFAGEGRALEAAVEEIERQRRALADEEQRLGFAATTRKVMEQGAVSLSDRGRWAESFAFADRLRARALWDAVTPSSGELRELQRQSLADGEAVLSFLVLPDRILGWWVRRDSVAGFRSVLTRDELENLVQRFRQAARGDQREELLRLRSRLSDLLLSEVRSELGGIERLIVVPDGPLEELPFAALEGEGGGFLIESVAVTTVPTAALYPLLSRRAERPRVLSRWLLVADPAHSATAFPALGRSTAGHSVIEGWPSGPDRHVDVLTGDAATPAAFLRWAPAVDLLVFLGHALAPTAFSTRAGLVLAADEGDDGLLRMQDIGFEGGASPGLAVLAGCDTGRGRATAADGSLTLGRAFLRAGVPKVVATLWDVDAASAAEMTQLVLAAVVDDEDDPLRVAQRRAITSGAVPPSSWMAFQSLGGGG